MNTEKKRTTRKAFLSKAGLALASLFGFGYTVARISASGEGPDEGIRTLSEKEAGELIRNMGSQKQAQLKPEPPPRKGQIPGE